MNKIFVNYFILLLSASLVLSACSQLDVSQISDDDIDRITERVIVCNPPYIRHGVDCCLDTTGTGICDKDEKIIQKELEDEEVKEDFYYEKPDTEMNETNFTKELSGDKFVMNQTDINETINYFMSYIKKMTKFNELKGYGLSNTYLEIEKNNLNTEFIFFREQKIQDNVEYYKVKVAGSHMEIESLDLYEISHYKWEEVDSNNQDKLFLKCIKETNTRYYANEDCCHYQNDLLGDIFFNHKDIFYVDCSLEMETCIDAEIKGMPTWIINGNEKIGSFPKNQIAEFMECINVVSRKIDIK